MPRGFSLIFAQRIREIDQSKVAYTAALGEVRSLNRQPFDLSDEVAVINWHQQIAIDSWECTRATCIESHRLWCFDIEKNLDFIG